MNYDVSEIISTNLTETQNWSQISNFHPYFASCRLIITPTLCQAKQISAAYDEKHDAKSLQQLKKFVSKLPSVQAEKKALETQTAIAGLVRISSLIFEAGASEQLLQLGLNYGSNSR